jgi:hypothetical protein
MRITPTPKASIRRRIRHAARIPTITVACAVGAMTDAKGRYTFHTIRPANYPNTTVAQHIHMHVIERGCATYFIDELLFTDDPMFQRMDPEAVLREGPGRGGKGITTPRRDASGTWHVERDIHLGRNIPGYPGCSASRFAAATERID